ncbi:MAG: hypothetical protein HY788_20595 [Deltaproteobacteria bacterium]|nr:hypothetical protein [Deltaproteobacteria bacterium]
MEADRENLLNVINQSAEELQRGIDKYRCLVASLLQDCIDEKELKRIADFGASKSNEAKLREAVMEAIEVLEESRKAFKSKQLELLRKRLTQVLIEAK